MDKVKFFAIFIPVLIGLAFLFRILIPVVVASIVIFIITMILSGKKNKTGGFFSTIKAREPAKFVCLECGFYHNDNVCPKCGSKIKKYHG
ncbi:hypothetical protein HY212_00515 [Candidatus Pacearchaeota archaeon]|nr:hypothetical protein [Candidatus Pacearchaeota archaeon]